MGAGFQPMGMEEGGTKSQETGGRRKWVLIGLAAVLAVAAAAAVAATLGVLFVRHSSQGALPAVLQ